MQTSGWIHFRRNHKPGFLRRLFPLWITSVTLRRMEWQSLLGRVSTVRGCSRLGFVVFGFEFGHGCWRSLSSILGICTISYMRQKLNEIFWAQFQTHMPTVCHQWNTVRCSKSPFQHPLVKLTLKRILSLSFTIETTAHQSRPRQWCSIGKFLFQLCWQQGG